VTNVPKSACWISNAPNKAAGYIGSDSTVADAHCTAANQTTTAPWTRLRNVYTAADLLTAAPAAATITTTTGSHLYMTYMWEGFVSLNKKYTGASLLADINCGDYYGATYLASGQINPTIPTNTGETDKGDIGSSSFTVTTAHTFFWSQFIIAYPQIDGTGVASYYSSVEVFLSGYNANGAGTTANGVFMIRVRGKLNSTEPNGPSGAALALFFDMAGNDPFFPINPINAASDVQAQCFANATLQTCQKAKYGLDFTAGTFVNGLDKMEIITTNIALSTQNEASIGILVDNPGSDLAYTYRLAFSNSNGYFYIAGFQQTQANVATNYGQTANTPDTVVNFPSSSTCDILGGSGGTGPGVRITTNPATDVVDTVINTVTLNVQL
jgi:hypothetical protein